VRQERSCGTKGIDEFRQMKRNFDERWEALLEEGKVRPGDTVRHKSRTGAVLHDGRIKETGFGLWRDPLAFVSKDNRWHEASTEEYLRRRKMIRSCVCIRGGVESKLECLLARECDDLRGDGNPVDHGVEDPRRASMSAGTHFLPTGPGERKQAWAGDAAMSFDAAKVYVTQENQTPRKIAKSLGVSLELLLAFNRGDVGGLLRPSSKFRSGTVLYVPPTSHGRSPEAKGMERPSRLPEVMRHVLSRMDTHEHVLMVGCCSRALSEAAQCPLVWHSILKARFGEGMAQHFLAGGRQGQPPVHPNSRDRWNAKGENWGQTEQARGPRERGHGRSDGRNGNDGRKRGDGRNEVAKEGMRSGDGRDEIAAPLSGTALEILNMLVW